MSNIICYDSDGKILSHYTQWDVNQKLIIRGAKETTAPLIHFSNRFLEKTIVTSSMVQNGSIEVNIPDILLQYSDPIIVHLYYKNEEEGTSKYSVRIPVVPKKQPEGYLYGDGNGGIVLDSERIIVADNKPSVKSVLWFNTQNEDKEV